MGRESTANILHIFLIFKALVEFFTFIPVNTVFVFIGFGCLGIFSIYWLLIYNRLILPVQNNVEVEWPPVSIIICIRNQFPVFKNNIHLFLEQNYPQFELLIVDDDSSDGLESWIREISQNEPKISYFKNQKTQAGKKQALTLGISNAQFEWLALTDADCKPEGKNWLQSMMQGITNDQKIILGYAPYQYVPGILNQFIRFECCFNALQFFAASHAGFPYMGSGRNLMYHRSIFNQQALQNERMYGDDDLLINARSNSDNTGLCLNPKSFIFTDAKSSYIDYFRQRWRHYAAALHYNLMSRVLLLFYFISFIGLYVCIFYLLIQKNYFIASSLYVCHLLVSWPVFRSKLKLFKEKNLSNFFPILQILYCLHLIFQFPFLWIKKKHW